LLISKTQFLKTSKISSFTVAFICDAACKKVPPFLTFYFYMRLTFRFLRNAFSALKSHRNLLSCGLFLYAEDDYMSQIQVQDLTFGYDTSYENIFDHVSFQIDTDWKLGFIGRNGRGKTTFLNLLMGKHEYTGSIISSVTFDYFPFEVKNGGENTLSVIKSIIAPFALLERRMEELLNQNSEQALQEYSEIQEQYSNCDGYIIDELIEKEISKLNVAADVLTRPFETLSNGERTKLLLAALFLKKNNFLLIDEPTNHLDMDGRKTVADYLKAKKSFILVSHDRDFLDAVIDHVLSINRSNIEVQRGNFSSWQQNKERQDAFELAENEKLKKDIQHLKAAAKRTSDWADKVERTKIGFDPAKTEKSITRRPAAGAKSKKMMQRSKNIQQRQESAIEEKGQLLKNLEQAETLKMNLLTPPKEQLAVIKELSIIYGEKTILNNINFTVNQGERVALQGKNGCGKSSILKLLMGEKIQHTGICQISSQIITSYVPQDTSFLHGSLKEFAQTEQIDESLFKAILRKLDFTRVQFEKDMSEFSGGQKKKVLIAKSLSQPAHLYIWDEPLNFIDVLSRIQIEELILAYCPTLLFVEHDNMFSRHIATKTVVL
jgi:lincosamide and streptogramin A transport system ATP-binding/permease protein